MEQGWIVTSWIEISTQRLSANYSLARQVLDRETGTGAALLGVIKANAYGHGAGLCAAALAEAGAPWLGVTDSAEGASVRAAMDAAGIPVERQPDVLVMCGNLPEEATDMVRHGLTPVVWNVRQMEALARAAEDKPVPVHLEIDTGMSRQGVAPGAELRTLFHHLAAEPRLRLDGVMTHFASAEVAHGKQTPDQRDQFEAALQMVDEAGLRPAWVHAGNTSALDNGVDEGAGGGTLAWLTRQATRLGARTMVREGLGLYGYCLPLDGLAASDGAGSVRLRPQVLPVMTWKTRVLSLQTVEKGTSIGYNGTYVAPREMTLALLPVGYAVGLRRELSSSMARAGGWVMVRGKRAPIVGRISMNLTTVDVSGIEGMAAGDEVVLLGPGITAEDHAALAGTIAYEILCGVRGRLVAV